MRGWNGYTYDLAKDICDNLTSPFSASERILVVGAPGSGKSLASLSIAYAAACRFSVKFYKEPDRYEEFFNVDENVAVISPEAIRALAKRARKPYCAYIYDDVGAVGWNNRKWQSKGNQQLNQIFAVQRPYSNLSIASCHSSAQIDSAARILFTKVLDCVGPHLFDLKMNVGKLFFCESKPRNKTNPVFLVYPKDKRGTVYEDLVWYEPPDHIVDRYNKIRHAEMEKLLDMEIDAGAENAEKQKAPSKREEITGFIAKHPPPDGKKERIGWMEKTAKTLSVSQNYLYRVLNNKL